MARIGLFFLTVLSATAVVRAEQPCDTFVRFATHTVVSVATDDLVAADLDGDGAPDLLAAHRPRDLIWYSNVGDGLFGWPRVIDTYPTPGDRLRDPAGLAAADLDGDGDLDVVAALPDHETLAWYRNLDGQGAFGSRTIITWDESVHDVAAVDLDGDGDRDLLIAAEGGAGWHENLDGNGLFSAVHRISPPYQDGEDLIRAVPADIDGDGAVDVLTVAHHAALLWCPNLGARVFGECRIVSYSFRALDVAAADIDGDLDLDVLAAYWSTSPPASWFENIMGDGAFGLARPLEPEAGGMGAIAVADIDDDGTDDVVVGAHYGDYSVAWYPNHGGNGGFGFRHEIAGTNAYYPVVTALASADFDGDGDRDVASARGWLTSQGGIFLHEQTHAADCDRNGVPDVCDPDCNDNGRPDGCDILLERSDDCDIDGVPDDCQPDIDGDSLIDACDNCPAAGNVDQRDLVHPGGEGDACEDPDGDGVPDLADTCPDRWNPSQPDRDGDGLGDACDLDDGLIELYFAGRDRVEWLAEDGFLWWNVYAGDLDLLRLGAPYTQEPGSNPLAERRCGLLSLAFESASTPVPGGAAFFLVGGISWDGRPHEGDLGFDSTGAERPNTRPCVP